jgi:aldehyde dehydrogenase (NAD+)
MVEVAHLLANEMVSGDQPPQPHHSPIDGSEQQGFALAGIDMGSRAVTRAGQATDACSDLAIDHRAFVIRSLAEALEADAEALAERLIAEVGCPRRQAISLQVLSAVGVLQAIADLVESHEFEAVRKGLRGGEVLVRKHPVGVCAGIVPWNVPVFLACMKLGQAIAAGCPIILKPSPENAASMARFAGHIAALDLPAGSVSLLTGDRDLGVQLVADPRVAKVSFTGSTVAGRAVAVECAKRLARCTLELGGKSAAILLDDFELGSVREQFFLATLQNNGQVCGAQSRVLVPQARFSEMSDMLGELFESLRVGDPRSDLTDIGPLASFRQRDRVQSDINQAIEDGAEIVARPGFDLDGQAGAFVQPTLFTTKNPELAVVREEVFGPVTVMMAYEDEDHAIELANGSDYGLSGSIWTPDIARGLELARHLKTGSVGINSKKILDFGAPFGGHRNSGLGRELGPEGIDAYLETTSIIAPSVEFPGTSEAPKKKTRRRKSSCQLSENSQP